jgi:hypothetical protein
MMNSEEQKTQLRAIINQLQKDLQEQHGKSLSITRAEGVRRSLRKVLFNVSPDEQTGIWATQLLLEALHLMEATQ